MAFFVVRALIYRDIMGCGAAPKLVERAELAAKQIRYFRLFSQKGSFVELGALATHAGFKIFHEDIPPPINLPHCTATSLRQPT
ncbi:MAG: hypothetical protein P4M05_31130 [Bradyrhizobium sp.]|nr:hypothetical protein [Bradyrhizobium sp.]